MPLLIEESADKKKKLSTGDATQQRARIKPNVRDRLRRSMVDIHVEEWLVISWSVD
jgi:hypothetical protein